MQHASKNPYYTGIAPSPRASDGKEDIDQFVRNKTEEYMTHKAPDVLPAQMQTSVDLLGDVFIKMMQLKAMVERASAVSSKLDQMEALVERIDQINSDIAGLTDMFYDIKL